MGWGEDHSMESGEVHLKEANTTHLKEKTSVTHSKEKVAVAKAIAPWFRQARKMKRMSSGL